MQPGVTDSQATDSHVKCIKLTDRQVASSQLTDRKGKQPMASSQTKSDNQTGNGLAGDKYMCKQPTRRQTANSWLSCDNVRLPGRQQAGRYPGGDNMTNLDSAYPTSTQ